MTVAIRSDFSYLISVKSTAQSSGALCPSELPASLACSRALHGSKGHARTAPPCQTAFLTRPTLLVTAPCLPIYSADAIHPLTCSFAFAPQSCCCSSPLCKPWQPLQARVKWLLPRVIPLQTRDSRSSGAEVM